MKLHTSVGVASCLVILVAVAYASDHTHIDNHSKKWTIIASTSYSGGHSKFVDRKIVPGGSDVDEYSSVDFVELNVQIEGAPDSNHFYITADASVVAEDTPDNDLGLDFWLNDGSGNPLKEGSDPTPLMTIFGPEPPSPPPATPSPPVDTQGNLEWKSITDEGCKAPGYRQQSARLMGSSSRSNWDADCKKTPFKPNDFETLSGDDTTCTDAGLLRGEIGSWMVFDKSCLPNWGSFKDDGCKSRGFRQYSSVLWDIPWGQSWEDWCKNLPTDIKGVGPNMQHFYKPDRCVNTGYNMWGEFDYPDNSCCGTGGDPGGKHDEIALGARKLLFLTPRCDALGGAQLPITAAAFLLALLHSVRDQAEIQVRNTAIQAVQPPANSAGRNPRTRTLFWERDLYEEGSNNGQLRDIYRVPVFQAYPVDQQPIARERFLPSPSDEFDATWVPRYTVGQGPLNVPSFTHDNPGGVIDIPASAFVTIDASGPDVLLTAQLTGCAFVWAYDPTRNVFYAAHLNPDPTLAANAWAQTGNNLANALMVRGRFHGTELRMNVYGRTGYGYTDYGYGNIMAVRNRDTMQWEVIAQSLHVVRAIPTDVETVDYDAVQPDGS